MRSVPVMVDAHVHLHPCFDRQHFLEGALENFRAAVQTEHRETAFYGFLLFADIGKPRTLESISSETDGTKAPWTLRETRESISLVASGPCGGQRLILVSGQQIRTRERLEILTLGTTEAVPDGLPFFDALERAREAAPVVSVPWGLGKWWFRRRRIIQNLLRPDLPDRVFLGDNAGRPPWMPGPRRIQADVAERSKPVLPGSDPLPFTDHEGRAGSFGFTFVAKVDPDHPFQTLADHLLGGKPIHPYGEHRELYRIFADQIRIRFHSSEAVA